ncbi:MAG: hypothetical protein RIA71_15955 [Oceanicaulis sp.]
MTIATEIKPGPFEIKGQRLNKAEKTRLAASGLKRCPACGHAKPFEAFGENDERSDGLRSTCKACAAAYIRRHRLTNPEADRRSRQREKAKLYRAKAILMKAVRHFEGREDWLSRIAHEIDDSPYSDKLTYISRDLDGLVSEYVYGEV